MMPPEHGEGLILPKKNQEPTYSDRLKKQINKFSRGKLYSQYGTTPDIPTQANPPSDAYLKTKNKIRFNKDNLQLNADDLQFNNQKNDILLVTDDSIDRKISAKTEKKLQFNEENLRRNKEAVQPEMSTWEVDQRLEEASVNYRAKKNILHNKWRKEYKKGRILCQFFMYNFYCRKIESKYNKKLDMLERKYEQEKKKLQRLRNRAQRFEDENRRRNLEPNRSKQGAPSTSQGLNETNALLPSETNKDILRAQRHLESAKSSYSMANHYPDNQPEDRVLAMIEVSEESAKLVHRHLEAARHSEKMNRRSEVISILEQAYNLIIETSAVWAEKAIY